MDCVEIDIVHWDVESPVSFAEPDVREEAAKDPDAAGRRCIRDSKVASWIRDRLDQATPLTSYPPEGEGDIRLVIVLSYRDGSHSTVGVDRFCSWLRRDGQVYKFDPEIMRTVARYLSDYEILGIQRLSGSGYCGLGPPRDGRPGPPPRPVPCSCEQLREGVEPEETSNN